MIIGYARVSTDDQRLDLQLSALEEAGCDKIFKDHGMSGSDMSRPGLDAALKSLKAGDTLVVWRLDRLGRSLAGLVRFIDRLGEKGVEFRTLTEAVDTSTSGGRLIFHIMAALAEFERNLISERTKAGLQAAKQRGRRLGRPPLELAPHQLDAARRAMGKPGCNVDRIAARYGMSPTTLKRRLNDSSEARHTKRLLSTSDREARSTKRRTTAHGRQEQNSTGQTATAIPIGVGPVRPDQPASCAR